jgi:hypothetical protein
MSALSYAPESAGAFLRAEWRAQVRSISQVYRAAVPFPHIHLYPFLDERALVGVAAEFPDPHSTEWIRYKHANENKNGLSRRDLFPPHIGELVDELNSPAFVSWISQLTEIPDLVSDPSLEGGGLHQSSRGGFLNVHTDFSVHHHRPNWRRRVNLILYLNSGWQTSWGGALELWDQNMKRCVVSYAPILNHAVIFNTDDHSLHGFPDALQCPEGVSRKSLALYYYTMSAPGKAVVRSTRYRPRPEDGYLKSLMMRLDSRAVDLYSRAKRRFGFSDHIASKLLSIFSRG